jgi:hypothetical protein
MKEKPKHKPPHLRKNSKEAIQLAAAVRFTNLLDEILPGLLDLTKDQFVKMIEAKLDTENQTIILKYEILRG